jgi:hypothetical protein
MTYTAGARLFPGEPENSCERGRQMNSSYAGLDPPAMTERRVACAVA